MIIYKIKENKRKKDNKLKHNQITSSQNRVQHKKFINLK